MRNEIVSYDAKPVAIDPVAFARASDPVAVRVERVEGAGRQPAGEMQYTCPALQQAYRFFNDELFGGMLPDGVLITLQRHARARGFFSANRFVGRTKEETTHELGMNPDCFNGTDIEILSTLVHEMVFAWQAEKGKEKSSRYHDRHWAGKMKLIGLQPSDTGKPGGKETGRRVSEYVIPDSPFAIAARKLLATGFKVRWQSRAENPTRQAKAKRASKTRYTCPKCHLHMWGKPGGRISCDDCSDAAGKRVCMRPG